MLVRFITFLVFFLGLGIFCYYTEQPLGCYLINFFIALGLAAIADPDCCRH